MKSFTFLLVPLLILDLGSWKRPDTTDSTSCRIVGISHSIGNEYILCYDSAGLLHTISQPQRGFTSTISYEGNTIVAEEFVNSISDKKVSYTLDMLKVTRISYVVTEQLGTHIQL